MSTREKIDALIVPADLRDIVSHLADAIDALAVTTDGDRGQFAKAINKLRADIEALHTLSHEQDEKTEHLRAELAAEKEVITTLVQAVGAPVPNHWGNIPTPPDTGADAQPYRCHAGRDGDCDWRWCPQNRDGEPGKTGRHCPLDSGLYDAEDYINAGVPLPDTEAELTYCDCPVGKCLGGPMERCVFCQPRPGWEKVSAEPTVTPAMLEAGANKTNAMGYGISVSALEAIYRAMWAARDL